MTTLNMSILYLLPARREKGNGALDQSMVINNPADMSDGAELQIRYWAAHPRI